MDFYFYLLFFIFVIIFALLLPTLSGVGGFKIGQKNSRTSNDHRLKFKLSSEKDIGKSSSHGFEIDSKTGLKKRVIGNYSEDPNHYDYDLDELISADDDENDQRPKAHV
ncbi:hypothetical protein ZYGR_0A01080 [Zygosaccharomyces rouxii]|uniref:ZYRO0A02442p n=2 Tax=Zygosaccharomyces rouxii TaxID=4956 RepID=C5DPD3_ZYGRC|nr:uncharacterized protein ZYRO0A02442g [Zygosaccharomyces rouxii]KAH9198936.1 hypothetical protein LQ764DRAFT_235874 [Zygosaccharomyces rouxii]GAV46516.1 hypothetical protein ZYGR_0A01080 [Zygosaccharomyces rouxii]CAR25544.1 ZYRO0A02442p [Zygosaccharomyces rouxii]